MASNLFRMGWHSNMPPANQRALFGLEGIDGWVKSDVVTLCSRWSAALGHPEMDGGGIGGFTENDPEGRIQFGDLDTFATDLLIQTPLSEGTLKSICGWNFNQTVMSPPGYQYGCAGDVLPMMFKLTSLIATGAVPCRLVLWPLFEDDGLYTDAGYDPGFFPPIPLPE